MISIRIKIKVESISVGSQSYHMTGYIVPDSEYLNETSLIDGFQYRYIKTEGSYHYYRDMDIYQIPLSYISFNNN